VSKVSSRGRNGRVAAAAKHLLSRGLVRCEGFDAEEGCGAGGLCALTHGDRLQIIRISVVVTLGSAFESNGTLLPA
jgi:hypothetical protein